ncbi:MAG TPA: hypothetical protein VMN57_09250 [Anaerolineales bacterium]|nr:hypothetical protein [Anaerolineales bacterium]
MGLAARGARRLGDETEQIDDREELSRVRKQAVSVQLKATAAAVALTALALLAG